LLQSPATWAARASMAWFFGVRRSRRTRGGAYQGRRWIGAAGVDDAQTRRRLTVRVRAGGNVPVAGRGREAAAVVRLGIAEPTVMLVCSGMAPGRSIEGTTGGRRSDLDRAAAVTRSLS
jgi:hypothetical protein